MLKKVIIRDNEKSPLKYISKLDKFKNGTEFIFKPGVNVIIGENGSGKTTLLNLIKAYLMVDFNECGKGAYNCNISALYKNILDETEFCDGIDIYADYDKNTFRLSHAGEKEKHGAVNTFDEFGAMVEQKNASTGEGVVIAMNSLFRLMFSQKASLHFNYSQFNDEYYPDYANYIKEHKVEGNEWTILMDEPDRNLSIDNLEQIKSILSFHKEDTQLIAVVHNPLLIYNLSKLEDVNVIEMTEGYAEKVRNVVDNLVGINK